MLLKDLPTASIAVELIQTCQVAPSSNLLDKQTQFGRNSPFLWTKRKSYRWHAVILCPVGEEWQYYSQSPCLGLTEDIVQRCLNQRSIGVGSHPSASSQWSAGDMHHLISTSSPWKTLSLYTPGLICKARL